MTPPPDFLVAAIRATLDAVDVVVCIRGQSEMCPCCRARASAEGRASISALAAAVRGWVKEQFPEPAPLYDGRYMQIREYVARRLGL